MKLIRSDQEIGGISVVGRRVCNSRRRFDWAGRGQVKAAHDAVVTLCKSRLEFVTQTHIQGQLLRPSPIILKEGAVIKILHGIIDWIIDLAGVRTGAGGRYAQKKRRDVTPESIPQRTGGI